MEKTREVISLEYPQEESGKTDGFFFLVDVTVWFAKSIFPCKLQHLLKKHEERKFLQGSDLSFFDQKSFSEAMDIFNSNDEHLIPRNMLFLIRKRKSSFWSKDSIFNEKDAYRKMREKRKDYNIVFSI